MSSGILPLEELKHQITLNTGFFECSAYTEDAQMRVCSGNHDGAGMSGGNLQYNFGDANRLRDLWQYMITNHEQICIDAFGSYTSEYDTWRAALMSPNNADRINFGANITDPNNDHAIIEPYKTCLGNLLITPECKAEYYSIRDMYYWGNPYSIFRQMSCKSRAALASFFDVYINKGRYYPINLLQVDFEAIDADDTLSEDQKEAQKIRQINIRANEEENALNDTSSTYFDDRRNAMRDQGGNYYGLNYDPETQFDINQEPAIREKTNTLGVKIGSLDVDNVFIGNIPIDKIYLGTNLLGGAPAPFQVSTVPQTQFRTNPNNYAGIGAVTSINLTSGQPIWIDVQNFVACKTYYTVDGSTPTESSALYTGALSFTETTVLKVLTVSIFGVSEAVKTLTINIAGIAPTTTISPSEAIQNNIPITITLTTSESGAAIKYRLGTDTAVKDYTAPFEVNQNTPEVNGTSIKITYWAVGAEATELEKVMTYDTSGAVPSKSTLTAVAGNAKVDLSWTPVTNATAFTLYRSEVSGQLGSIIGNQYMTMSNLSYTDDTAINGVTYYYTIRAANYSANRTDSDQKSATPIAPAQQASYRYLKVEGYGAAESGQEVTTRTVEIEAYVDTTNVALNKTIVSGEPASTGGAPLSTIVNGNKTSVTSGSYPIWWTSPTPNGNVVIDLGSSLALTKLSYYGYSISGVQRTNRFKILGSNTNNGTDWVSLWDNSLGQEGLQPILPSGYNHTL